VRERRDTPEIIDDLRQFGTDPIDNWPIELLNEAADAIIFLRSERDDANEEIARLRDVISHMRSRVETLQSPFDENLEIRVVISALEMREAKYPHMLIDAVIDNARRRLHYEADRGERKDR